MYMNNYIYTYMYIQRDAKIYTCLLYLAHGRGRRGLQGLEPNGLELTPQLYADVEVFPSGPRWDQ